MSPLGCKTLLPPNFPSNSASIGRTTLCPVVCSDSSRPDMHSSPRRSHTDSQATSCLPLGLLASGSPNGLWVTRISPSSSLLSVLSQGLCLCVSLMLSLCFPFLFLYKSFSFCLSVSGSPALPPPQAPCTPPGSLCPRTPALPARASVNQRPIRQLQRHQIYFSPSASLLRISETTELQAGPRCGPHGVEGQRPRVSSVLTAHAGPACLLCPGHLLARASSGLPASYLSLALS